MTLLKLLKLTMLNNNITPDSLSIEDHQRVAAYMNKNAGIQLPKAKKNLIETRLRKRQRTLGFASLKQYIDHALGQSSEEHVHLVDALTTNKTEFFREKNHYDYYINYLNQNAHHKDITIWSAGCSSGEEPYTLAILANEHNHSNVSIHATDISVSMLNKAKRAVYPHTSVTPIPLPMRQRHLLRRKREFADEVKIAPHCRDIIRFYNFNLVTGQFAALPEFNIIFCRNVMIYFSAEQREKIVHQFTQRLVKGGLLFIGHSETINSGKSQLRVVAPTIYQKV